MPAPSFTVTEVPSVRERVERDPFLDAVEEPRDRPQVAVADMRRIGWPQGGVLTALRPGVAP